MGASIVSIIIHTATCIDKEALLNLITGLKNRRQASNKESYLVHVCLFMEP